MALRTADRFFVRPANFDVQKTKKFRSLIGYIENMHYDSQEEAFLCAQGRKLLCKRADRIRIGAARDDGMVQMQKLP